MSVMMPNPFDRVLAGQVIPAFSLKSTTNARVRSAELVGHRLVIAFTGLTGDRRARVLLGQLGGAYPAILAEGAIAIAIAPTAVDTGYLAEPGVALPFPTLRDPAALVHRRFGAVGWSGAPAPALFVTDPIQRVVFRAMSGLGEPLPGVAPILAVMRLDKLTCPLRLHAA